jgi:O-antigen ligase
VVIGLGDPTLQGRQLALAAVLLVAVGRREAWAAALVLGVGLGLSGSRGAWLAAAAGLLAALPPGGLRVRRQLGGVVAAAVVVGALMLAVLPDVRAPLPHGDREALTSGRDAIWLNTLDIVIDHPLFGVGAGAVPAVYTPYRDARMAAGGLHSKAGRDPHSHYLQLLAETGPIGLLLFLAGLLLALRAAPRDAAMVLLFAAVAAATLSSIEHRAFWLALACGALGVDRRQS